jgi:hypothetical protein
MRLISQTGDIDVPYESSAIARADGLIVAYSVNYDSNKIVMGMYSTEEKAIKAMEMLHNTYTGAFFAQNIEVPEDIEKEFMNMAATKGFGIIKTAIDSSDIKFEPANIVFRFPEDDEV